MQYNNKLDSSKGYETNHSGFGILSSTNKLISKLMETVVSII
jgi:hypothetical protein